MSETFHKDFLGSTNGRQLNIAGSPKGNYFSSKMFWSEIEKSFEFVTILSQRDSWDQA